MSKIISKYPCRAVGIFILFCSLFAISCETSSKSAKSGAQMPDWVTGVPSAYPKQEYLTGTGSASEKRLSEIDAINNLVSIFGQSINSSAMASRRMAMAQSAGVVASSDASALGQDILREVNQNDVIAIEVPEFFESKSENKWYALAIMNRAYASQIYSSMIEKNQAEISSILAQYKSSAEPNTLLNFSRLDFAEEIAGINETYLKRLTILNPAIAKKYDSITTAIQIHKMKSELAAQIPICVTMDGEIDSDGRIAKSFQEVMSSFGFNTTLGSNERYVISSKIYFTQSENANTKTQFCEYAVEASLNDTFSGETLVPLSITGREGSPTYQNAQTRAKQKIITKVKSDFAQNFQKYLGEFSAF
ncbi:MAG: LPP20 family lipoprotein [Treponema sp.]|nr:LPP20 family lipoprotein [Treponema sp.]